MNKILLEKLFGSGLRVSILSFLLAHQGEEFYSGEIARLIEGNRANTSRELSNLEQIGIIYRRKDEKQPNRSFWSLNQHFPLINEMKSIFMKTTGAESVLKKALSDIKGIDCAFIYGSVAAGTEGPSSDIDVFIIGNIPLEDLSKIIENPEKILGRTINPSLFSKKEFKNRIKKLDPFVSRLIAEPRILMVGEPDELQKLIG
jgi:predicted nucleotidyltransferase